jgi:chorismate dehydratase
MHSPPGRFEVVWDLGDEWCRWAELPFVFAMWVGRSGAELRGLDTALEEAREAGLAHLDEIAQREAAPLGLTRPQCVSYLRDNLYFYLGPREQRGLDLFHSKAAQLGIVPSQIERSGIEPSGVEFGLNDCQTSG